MWWAQQDSNLRPADYESVALPLRHGPVVAELYPTGLASGLVLVRQAAPADCFRCRVLCTRSEKSEPADVVPSVPYMT